MARSQEIAQLFEQPGLPAHRRDEICRLYFYESACVDEIPKRFYLHTGSVRGIVRDFARAPDVRSVFATARPGREASPKRDGIHDRALKLRRQRSPLAGFRATLRREGLGLSASCLSRILRGAGLRLPRGRRSGTLRSRATTRTKVA
jgi:hypothetical protein